MAWAFFEAVTNRGIQSQHFEADILEIFGTIMGSSGLCLRLGFNPGADVFGFCCVLLLEK